MTFNGQLNANEIFASLFNMIIGQHMYADNIDGTYGTIMEESRVDGSLFGDTKLYYASDVLHSHEWGADDEATNLLAVHRPPAPKTQKILLDIFRQIDLTIDEYLTKRAWIDANAFSQFNSVMLQLLRDSKRVYDATTFNAYIGTAEATVGKQMQTITLPANYTPEQEAKAVATRIADIMVELKNPTRLYNSYGYMRSLPKESIRIVFNSKFANRITYTDLPAIYNNEDLKDILSKEILPSAYFGTVNTSSGTVPANNTTIRALRESSYTVGGTKYELFANELLPDGASYDAKTTYTENENVICKIMHKMSVPFMSAFSVQTSFFNPKALLTNHYLTWGHNTLNYLENYPFITIKEQIES